jgi:transcriptional regulator with XRE-family HTH domain
VTQEELALKLRVLRAEKGLSLRRASLLTGVDAHSLSALERGQHKPWDRTLGKIARGYGIPVSELLEAAKEGDTPLAV